MLWISEIIGKNMASATKATMNAKKKTMPGKIAAWTSRRAG